MIIGYLSTPRHGKAPAGWAGASRAAWEVLPEAQVVDHAQGHAVLHQGLTDTLASGLAPGRRPGPPAEDRVQGDGRPGRLRQFDDPIGGGVPLTERGDRPAVADGHVREGEPFDPPHGHAEGEAR